MCSEIQEESNDMKLERTSIRGLDPTARGPLVTGLIESSTGERLEKG